MNKHNILNYYNSGVLYIDTNKWINNDNQNKLIKYLYKMKKTLNYPDQDLLNFAIPEEIGILPLEYNLSPYTFAFNDSQLKKFFNDKLFSIGYDEITEAIRNPIIFHSYGLLNIKPWQNNSVNPYNDIFREYIKIVNPNFKPLKLNKVETLLTKNPEQFYKLLIIKAMIPYQITEKTSELVLKLQYKK